MWQAQLNYGELLSFANTKDILKILCSQNYSTPCTLVTIEQKLVICSREFLHKEEKKIYTKGRVSYKVSK
jgi:hypothetical protein